MEETGMRPVPAVCMRIVLGALLGLAPFGIAGAETVRIHVTVETQGSPGQQVSYFRAFTTTDEAGTERVVVSRLCVKGIGHETQEKCEENVSFVEVVERAVGLPGVGSRCVEALASATWKAVPLSATARACP